MRAGLFLLSASILPGIGVTAWGQEPSPLRERVSSYPALGTSEREAIENLAQELKQGHFAAVRDFAFSSDMKDVQVVVRKLLEQGANPRLQARYLELLSNRQGTYIRFLEQLRKEYLRDPARVERLRERVGQLRTHFRHSRLKLPTPQRCLTILPLLLVAHEVTLSFRSSFLEPSPEVDSAWKNLDRTALTGLMGASALACFADLVVFSRSLPAVVASSADSKETRRVLNHLTQYIDEFRKDPQALNRIRGLNHFTQMDTRSTHKILSEALLEAQKSDVHESWISRFSEYLNTKRAQGLLRRKLRSLTPTQQQELVNMISGTKLNAKTKRNLSTRLSALDREIRSDFKVWLKDHPRPGVSALLDSSFQVEEDIEALHRKVESPSRGTRACWFGIGNALLAVGYLNALGKDETPLDINPFDRWLRDHMQEVYTSAAALLGATCLYNGIEYPFRRRTELSVREKYKRLSEKDWDWIRKSALKSRTESSDAFIGPKPDMKKVSADHLILTQTRKVDQERSKKRPCLNELLQSLVRHPMGL